MTKMDNTEAKKMDKMRAIARVPASTTNLGPGFDVLGLAVQLYSTVELAETDSGVQLEIHGTNRELIPSDESNPAYKAAKFIFEKVKKQPEGVKLTITNGIPVERGLGGSGTAILGGLLTANLICGEPFSKDELLNFAAELEGHPDNVSASLLGGLVVVCVNDGRIHYVKLECPGHLKIAFVIPDFPLATEKARIALPQTVPHKDAVFNVSRCSLLIASILTGKLDSLSIGMTDKLHQPYRKSLIPGVEDVFDAALNAGALSVALSGAGPTVAAFCVEKCEDIATNMKRAFEVYHIDSETKVLDIDYEGAVVGYAS